jgi:hypothetical protein
MATPTQDYQRGVGTGEQLPYGEATAENQNLALGNAVEKQVEDNAIDVPDYQEPQYARSETPDFKPTSGMDEVLFGPQEGIKPVGGIQDTTGPLPHYVIRALPQLAQMAAQPGAPPQVVAAYRFLVQKLEAEMVARGNR